MHFMILMSADIFQGLYGAPLCKSYKLYRMVCTVTLCQVCIVHVITVLPIWYAGGCSLLSDITIVVIYQLYSDITVIQLHDSNQVPTKPGMFFFQTCNWVYLKAINTKTLRPKVKGGLYLLTVSCQVSHIFIFWDMSSKRDKNCALSFINLSDFPDRLEQLNQ